MKLLWDQVGERVYETGVDHGVLYTHDQYGVYNNGYAWNGLTTVTESPTGAEATPQWADNIKYLNLVSTEWFGGTVEAFTYPKEFEPYDGNTEATPGVIVGQQNRGTFGLGYRTKVGNDVDGQDHGYKIHLIYGALAAPSEKAYATVNDTPEAIGFSWAITTTPVDVPGLKPTATLTINSTEVDVDALATLEDILYGTTGQAPRLPLPAEIIAIFASTVVEVTPTAPTFNNTTKVITIPSIVGVEYKINNVIKAAGALPAITVDTLVTADPKPGFKFPPVIDVDWLYEV